MNLDTIFYALIAVVLLARLWMLFGTRNGNDPQRPNPFAPPAVPPDEGDAVFAPASSERARKPPNALPSRGFQIPPDSLEGGLQQVKALDKNFDEKQFLQSIKIIFAQIIEDFAKGDLTRSESLLDAGVLASFRAAIAQRREANHSLECRILRLKEAEVIAANSNGMKAFITVRFVSEQENTLRDASGQVMGGGERQVEEITDIWRFARDTNLADGNWLLIETRG